MVKVEVIEQFSLKDFDKLVNIKRGTGKNKKGELYPTDTFECSKEMVEYLTGKNPLNKVVVKVIEVEPEEVTEEVVQAVADAIVDEAKEQDKSVEEIVEEIIEEKPKKKKSSKK